VEADNHIGENAELYAVGALSEDERGAVDAHAAHCPDCLRRLGEAEETVLALEGGLVARSSQRRPQRRAPIVRGAVSWWAIPAIAAALIVGMLIPRPAPQQNPAMLAMIHSHFSHAQFIGGAAAPDAKVLYARDRSWYYVIVEGTHRFGVFGRHGGRFAMLGATRPVRGTSELFARPGENFDHLELREGNAVVESASIR